MMAMAPLVIVLVGPTASGKTALLDAIFGDEEARRGFGLPKAMILSADSMQAYRGMDIGTAKPDAALLSRLPHRLIDIRNIDEQYSVGDFVHLADEACAKAWADGILPIVAGGTGFYARNFICGLPSAPPADPAVRAAVAADLAAKGAAALRAELGASDPESAARIHPNDLYRLTRALEIVRITGRPMADFAPAPGPRPGMRFAVFGIERPREALDLRIEARVDEMMAAGLADEVEGLRRAGHGADEPGMQAIGYREFFELAPLGLPTAGPGREAALAAIAEAIKRDTRQYAKRQMTFFRALPGIEWLSPDPASLAGRIAAVAGSGL
jgi:tRNA dimethylallyltransferase